ncbi:uncharacterized protein THITE_2106477 [Thermothielavioides terrestris NRRL 8126]|uniref:Uncharacterized protein n=1 Tax=Thermothielavioides terrestris (strain ATCC 38088 / NRRL 8126) TaxID=578455 RepID=G2QXQ7_THETT|nr:uncharacterized protein THITE_2106477 [Thermothielavioides terrestris NRRL 8126]AEO62375.1 hypothetical protein THITE_2106477 [Thermothielavioides terrestris NRRL 8126]
MVWDGSGDEDPVLPAANAGARPPTPLRTVQPPAELQHQQQHQHPQYQYGYRYHHRSQHQHQQHRTEHQQQLQHHARDASQMPPPSVPGPTGTLPPETSGKLSPSRTVERLAHKLSRQSLQLGPSSDGQLQTQPTPLLLSPPDGLQEPELFVFRDRAQRAVTDQSRPHPASAHTTEHNSSPSWLPPAPALDVGEPIVIDEAYAEQPDHPRLLELKQSQQRQTSGQLRGSSNARLVDQRLEDMVITGTQCNVRSEPGPSAPGTTTTTTTTTPSRPPSSYPIMNAAPAFIELDPDCAMPTPDLEVDDTCAEGIDIPDDLFSFSPAEGSISLRSASRPGGIRKYTVGGVSLRYRLAADAALRCANVVRSRPRMRKRTGTKTRRDSAPSLSAVASAMSSPAVSVAPSSPLLPACSRPP